MDYHSCRNYTTLAYISIATVFIDNNLKLNRQTYQSNISYDLSCACLFQCPHVRTVFANAIGTNTMPLEDPEGETETHCINLTSS